MSEKISVKLEALTQDFNRKMDASTKVVNKVANNTKELSRNVVLAGNSLNAMKTPLAGAGQKLSSFKNVLILANIQLVKMAAVMVTQGVKAMNNLVKSSFAATNATKLFNRELEVGGHGLKAGQDLVQRLSEKFNVHSSVVEDAATQLLRYGADINAVEGLLTAAGASSLAFSRDVATGFSNVAQAVMSEQSMMLNSIGISGNLSTAYRKKAKALGTTVDGLTNAQKATAAMNMTMTESAGEIEAVEVLMEGYGGASTRLTEAFTQMKISVGSSLESTITGMINFATKIINKVTEVADKVGDIKTAFQDLFDSPWLSWAKPLFTLLSNLGTALMKLLGLYSTDAWTAQYEKVIKQAQTTTGQETNFDPGGPNTQITGNMKMVADEIMLIREAFLDPANQNEQSMGAIAGTLTGLLSVVKGSQDTITRLREDPRVEARADDYQKTFATLGDALMDLQRQVERNVAALELNSLRTAELGSTVDEGASGGGGGGAGLISIPMPNITASIGDWFGTLQNTFGEMIGKARWGRQRGSSEGMGPAYFDPRRVPRWAEEIAAHLETMAFFTSNRTQDVDPRRAPWWTQERYSGTSIGSMGSPTAPASVAVTGYQPGRAMQNNVVLSAMEKLGPTGDAAVQQEKTKRRNERRNQEIADALKRLGDAELAERIAESNAHLAQIASDAREAALAQSKIWEGQDHLREEMADAAAASQETMAEIMLREAIEGGKGAHSVGFGGSTFATTRNIAGELLGAEPGQGTDGTVSSKLNQLFENVFAGVSEKFTSVDLVSGAFDLLAGSTKGLTSVFKGVMSSLSGAVSSAFGPVAGGIFNVVTAFIGRIFGRRGRLRDLLKKRRASKGKRIVTPWAEDPTPDEMAILSAQTVGRAASQPVLSTVQIQAGQNLLIASQSLQLAADTLLEAVTHRNFAASNALRAS